MVRAQKSQAAARAAPLPPATALRADDEQPAAMGAPDIGVTADAPPEPAQQVAHALSFGLSRSAGWRGSSSGSVEPSDTAGVASAR